MAPEIEDPEEPGWGQLEVRLAASTHEVANMHTDGGLPLTVA